MPVPGRFWGIGIAAAVLAHAAIVALIFWQPPESGALAPGRGGIEVSLGVAGAPPGSTAETVATTDARAVNPEEAVSDSTPRETTVARPVEDAAAADPKTVESRQVAPQAAAPDQPDAAESPPTEAPTIRQTIDSRQVEPEVAAAEEPEAAEAPPTEPVRTRQPDTAVTASAPAQTAVDAAPDEAQTASAASAPSSPAGTGGTSGANDGSGESASAGGTPGPSADYMAQLSAWLEKHKQYPRRAQRRRQEGTALLQFVIDREGRVIEYRIRESSGHEILDEEVAAMIERAQPLPGFPDDMPRARLELVVPIQFLLM